MIISVNELKKFITTNESDEVLEAKLQALEILIRKYTNNNFQLRSIRFECPIVSNKINLKTAILDVGDTIQISESKYNDGVYVIDSIEDDHITLKDPLIDEDVVLLTLVKYPNDIKMGVINMIKWDLENRDKVGIQSETISRHSVTFFNMDGNNSAIGYPKSIVGFLKPYMKARF